jgi:hypothetical protein
MISFINGIDFRQFPLPKINLEVSDKYVKSLILLTINLGSDFSDDLLRLYLLYIIIIYSISKN